MPPYYCKHFALLFNNYEFMMNCKIFKKEHPFSLHDLRVMKSIHKQVNVCNTICSMCVFQAILSYVQQPIGKFWSEQSYLQKQLGKLLSSFLSRIIFTILGRWNFVSLIFPPSPPPHNRQYGRMFYLPREMLPVFWTEDCVRWSL